MTRALVRRIAAPLLLATALAAAAAWVEHQDPARIVHDETLVLGEEGAEDDGGAEDLPRHVVYSRPFVVEASTSLAVTLSPAGAASHALAGALVADPTDELWELHFGTGAVRVGTVAPATYRVAVEVPPRAARTRAHLRVEGGRRSPVPLAAAAALLLLPPTLAALRPRRCGATRRAKPRDP